MGYYEFKREDAYEFARASGIQTKQRGDELQFLYCPYCNAMAVKIETGGHLLLI